jgi:hypothetical protein
MPGPSRTPETIISAYPSRRRAHLTTARLRRITAALAILAGGLLAWAAAAAPAASAAIIPVPDGPYGPAPASPVQVIAAGGMPGWQITVIALAAALAAAAAVFLDRARASRRSASAIG